MNAADQAIEEIREVRRRISAEFGHDITKYLTYLVYISYRDNVYDSSQEIIPWEIPLPETNDSTHGVW